MQPLRRNTISIIIKLILYIQLNIIELFQKSLSLNYQLANINIKNI
jgi:hypothetical protein